MVFVAVYGTLKQGNYNHDLKLARDPVYAGVARLPVSMWSNGRYPMIIHSNGVRDIFLEIYQVNSDELASLDDLEYPFDYHREQFTIEDFEEVWVYLYTPGLPPEEFHQVKSGNFVKEVEW